MSLWSARRIITLLLIATLIPAQGLAWPMPPFGWRAPGGPSDPIALRVFLQALNSTEQQVMTGPNRPQIYIVFKVDVAVPPAGATPLFTAADLAWFDLLMADVATPPAAPGALNTTEPRESILDDIAAGDAHVRSMQSATKLGAMPDTLEYEANPNASVPVERSMSVAIKDAVHEAGFDTRDGDTDYTPGTRTVTYEGPTEDGRIIVTGRLVDGQIVLTKEFKPLTGGGDVGDPVRIRGTSAPNTTQTGGAQTAAPQTTGPQTASVSTPAATPLVSSPTAYNKALMGELETKVRVITPNQTNSALMGQINIRDTHVAQMNNMATGFETLLKNPAQLDTVVRGLRAGAESVDNAYQNMLGAERALATLQGQNPRVDLKGQYEGDMRRAAQLEASGNTVAANEIRTQAANTAYGNFVQRQQAFYQALDQNPLLGLGERSLVGPDDFLFIKLRNTLSYNAPNSDYVALTIPYFERAAAEAREEATRAGAIDTAEGFTEFGGAKYDRTRAVMAAEGQANGSNLPQQLGDAAQGAYEQIEGGRAIRTEITNFGLNLVAGTAWVLPFIGPFISGGAAAIQVVREGDDLVVAVLDAEDARNLANVTGYTRIITAEDRVAAERGEFVLSVAGLALEGLQGIKVVKGPRATGAAADVTAATGNAAADATAAATRNAPTPGAAPAPTSTPRTNAPVREVGSDPLANTAAVGDKTQAFPDPPPTDPVGARGRNLTTAELASDKAAEIADEIQVYETNLAYARSVGVSDERIAQLTAGAKRGDTDVANALYREGLIAEGKQIDMPLDEYGQVKLFQTRSQLGTLTEADYQWLRNKLAADPNYLDNLPNRGRLTHPIPTPDSPTPGPIDDFDASITTAQRDALLNDPRVAQMVDEAKAAANAGTAQLPVGTTDPTRQLGPGASAPTVRVDPADTTPTVKLDPADATPTVRLDPADATPTVRLDRADATPTVRLDPADATPTVRLDPNKTSLIPPPSPATRVDPNKTVTMDPRAAAQATDELMQSLPKARQSGQSPQQAAALVRNAMTRFGVGPQQIVTALRQRLFSARPVSFADLGNAETAAARGDIAVSLQALGVSSGVAFNVNAVNSGKMPIQLQGEGIVIEPINGGSPISRTATTQVITEPVEAFCLERVRPVAPQGTQYRVAPPAMQTQHRRLVDILHAANRVMDASGLHPDSDPKTYFNFIRQWSIWSRQENFDEKRFSEEFMNQTKKNVESQGVKWTNQMQDTVRKAAPGRWRDILGVLTEATKLAPRG